MGLVPRCDAQQCEMTWGKGVAKWIKDPNSAMDFTQSLNDDMHSMGETLTRLPGLCGAMGSLTGHSILRPITWEGQAT